MNPQTIARVFGVLYLITFFTSIPAFFVFYAPVLDDPRYIVDGGADNSVALGALLELLLIIANIGTAVVLFPILKRQNEILIHGYVTARVVECRYIARLSCMNSKYSTKTFVFGTEPSGESL
jgi:Domain of unknown function (DUF4386)